MNKKMMLQAQQMQARMGKIQEEIAESRTVASAGGGAVKVTVIGGTRLESIQIEPEVVDAEDVESLNVEKARAKEDEFWAQPWDIPDDEW